MTAKPAPPAGLSSRYSLQPARLQTLTRLQRGSCDSRASKHKAPARGDESRVLRRGRGGGRSRERPSAGCGGSANLSGQHPALPHAGEDRLGCSSTFGPRRLFSPKGAFLPPPPPLAEPVSHGSGQIFPPQKRKGGQKAAVPRSPVGDSWMGAARPRTRCLWHPRSV